MAASLDQLNAVASQLQALTARLDQTTAELQTARQESLVLRQQMDNGVAAIPALAASVQTLAASVAAGAAPRAQQSLLDTRGLGKPSSFEDKEERFVSWVRKVENYLVASLGESFRPLLEWASEHETPVVQNDWDIAYGRGTQDEIPEITEKIAQLFTVLVALTDGESNDIVIGAGNANGAEAWRKLHRRWDPATGGRKRNLLKSIINPPKCKTEELSGCLERWLDAIKKYERRKNQLGQRATLDEDIKLAALEMLVPADLENHMVLNKHRLNTFESALAEIVAIVESRTGAKIKEPSIKYPSGSDHRGDPMDVDSLQWQAKGGKGGGKRDKGKGGKGAGKGKHDDEERRKQEECFNCGKKGHRAADCWAPKKKGDGKGKKGGKGGKGGKGKKGKKGAHALDEVEEGVECLDFGPLEFSDIAGLRQLWHRRRV